MNTYTLIYRIVKQIPEKTVATYGQIAALAGNRRWARVVGYALHVCPEGEDIPCHRVVTKDGGLSAAFGGAQMEMLAKEGVEFRNGRVIMEKYQWDTPWSAI